MYIWCDLLINYRNRREIQILTQKNKIFRFMLHFFPKKVFFNVNLMRRKHIFGLIVSNINIYRGASGNNRIQLETSISPSKWEFWIKKPHFSWKNVFLKCYFKGKIFFRLFFIKMYILCDLSINYRIRQEIQIFTLKNKIFSFMLHFFLKNGIFYCNFNVGGAYF